MNKNLLTLLLLGASFTLSAQQIEIPQKQFSLVTKRTATWCPYCGTWGWELYENLIADNSGKALLIAAHFSGELFNPTAGSISNNFGGFGQPLFFLGNENQGASSGNIDEKRNSIKSKINDAFLSPPSAQTGMVLVNNDNQLDVYTKTKFFENSNGAYYVGVYLIEKSLTHYQSGQGQDALHKNVLKESLTESAFGELITEGTVSAGAEFAFQVSLPLDESYDLGNTIIATIIWEKDDGTYKVVNCNFSDNFVDEVVATNEALLKIGDFKVSPNPASAFAEISLELQEDFDQAELSLIDAQGRKIQTLFAGNISAGTNRFTLNKEQIPVAGLYFVQFKANQKVVTRKIIFQ